MALFLVGAVSVHDGSSAYSSNTNAPYNSRSYTILAGSTATTVVVTANTLAVTTVPTGGTFTLTSSNGDTYASASTAYAETCNGYVGTVVVPAG